MNPPGAPMSGLSARSGDRPYELNDEMSPPVGFTSEARSVVQVIVVVVGCATIAALIAAPFVLLMPTTGMPTGGEPATVAFTMPLVLL
jgi:hypothetical protein